MDRNVAELASVGQHVKQVRAGYGVFLSRLGYATAELRRSVEVAAWVSWRCPGLWSEAAELIRSEGGAVDEVRTLLVALLLCGAMDEATYRQRTEPLDALRTVVLHYRTALNRPIAGQLSQSRTYADEPGSDCYRRRDAHLAARRARLLGSRRGRSEG